LILLFRYSGDALDALSLLDKAATSVQKMSLKGFGTHEKNIKVAIIWKNKTLGYTKFFQKFLWSGRSTQNNRKKEKLK